MRRDMQSDQEFDRIFQTLPGSAPTGAESRRERRRSGPEAPRSRGKAVFAVLAIVTLVLSGTGIWYVWDQWGQGFVESLQEEEIPDFEGGGAEPVIDLVIEPGDIGETVARKLFDEGVTASFEAVYQILLQDTSIVFQPGTYRLLTGMSAEAAVAALLDPANRLEWRVTLPEGVRLSRALEIIAENTEIPLTELQQAAKPELYGLNVPTGTLEGYLFPATYVFEPGSSATDVLGQMVDEMTSRLEALGVAPEDRHYVLTFAALVQRESRRPEDFAKVARVFQNRLDGVRIQDHNGRLQSDATYRDDLDETYDTYTIVGLPPGPIAMPGQLALEAVLNPAEGDWVYFVTINLETGETIFTSSLAEHNEYVPLLRQWCSENADYPGC